MNYLHSSLLFDSPVIIIIGNPLDPINCVRWNPSGDAIASASVDKSVKLIDLKSGKVILAGTTPDEGR